MAHSLLAIGDYQTTYHRTRCLLDGLRSRGVEVAEAPLRFRLRDKMFSWRWLPFWGMELAGRYLRLALAARRWRGRYVFVPYGSFFDVPVARLIAWWKRARVISDPVIFLHDTRLFNKPRPGEGAAEARLAYFTDVVAYRWPDIRIFDTEANRAYAGRAYGVRACGSYVVPVGADESVFKPAEPGRRNAPGTLDVIWYGRVSLMHGLDVILKAAGLLLEEPGIRFTIIGDRNSSYFDPADLARAEGRNLTMRHWGRPESILPADLAGWAREHDAALGCFGDTRKARETLITKEYEALAMGLPLITRDRGAANGILRSGETAWLVPAADPEALAGAVRALAWSPEKRDSLGRAGRAAFLAACSRDRIVDQFLKILEEN